MKNSEAMKCVAMIVGTWTTAKLTDENVRAYVRMILDLDFSECVAAINRLACTSKWHPSIADIREEVRRESSGLPDPEIAWGEVRKAISGYGRNRIPEFSCAEVAAAVDVVGWQVICNDENEMSTRARFVDAYRSYHNGTVRIEQLGPHAPQRTALPQRAGLQRLGTASPELDAPKDERQLSPWMQSIVDKYGLSESTEEPPEGE